MPDKRYRRKRNRRKGMRRLSSLPNAHLDTDHTEFESIYDVEHFYLRESIAERVERLADAVKLEPIHMLQVLLIEGLHNLEKMSVDDAREHINQTVNLKELLP